MSLQPRSSISWRTLSPLWAERLSITTTCPLRSVGARTCSTYASKTTEVVAPSTVREGPIPSALMLESMVVLAPRLRGTDQQALWPFSDQAYEGDNEVFVPISSTKSSRSVSTCSATITLQAHLKNSSRSSAPRLRFFERNQAASSAALRWSRSYPFPLCALGSDVFG